VSPVVAARCETLVKAENASNVRFEGLTFEACRQTALTLKNCADVTVAASTVRHTGGWAVRIDGGARDTVIGCDLYDLGEGGVSATGGDHDTLIPGQHLIENNHIHHIGRYVACYRPGAAVYGVGNTIRHNLIYQTDHQALFFDGNDHLIEYNIVHDICLHTSDAGPLYACTRDWSKRGTVIRHNLIHAAGDRVGPGDCNGIYLDDHTSGTLVYGNIISRCGWGIELGGGKDNVVSNNLVVTCRESIGLHSRGIDSFAKPDSARGRESGCFRLLLKKLDLYRSGLWTRRYPSLLAPLDMDSIDAQNAHGNVVRCNALAGSDPVKVSNATFVMRTCVVTNNPVFNDDPGFADLSALDFRLLPDAPVFKNLPDFHAPEFEKMGLYNSPLRASPAVKFGPQATLSDPVVSPLEREKAKVATLFPVRRTADQPALIQWTGKDAVAQRISRAELTVDDQWLNLTVVNAIDPHKKPVAGQAWGKADGMELALAIARGPGSQEAAKPFVLRGYASGPFESVTDGGATAADAARLAQAVRYTAKTDSPSAWSAQWRIPLAALGLSPKEPLLPLLAQMTVFRSSDRSLTRWSRCRTRDTWNVQGAYALWLTPFGELSFLPGAKPSVSRIAVSWGNDKVPMLAGTGAENPTWTTGKSRIEAQFGDVSADRWYAYEFEFTPEKDGTVVMELMGTQGEPAVWTAYDDIRVQGAEFTNGDFETVTPGGAPAGWHLPKPKDVPTQFIASKRLAASGTHFVLASHDFRPTQPLRVKGGQKITVNFQARSVLECNDAPY
jgi:parallel beta-helix repeat protein